MNNYDMPQPIFLAPGNLVRVKHEIENRPVMFIVEKVSKNVRNSETGDVQPMFMGMRCRWFNKNGDLQENVFSTKDLELIKE